MVQLHFDMKVILAIALVVIIALTSCYFMSKSEGMVPNGVSNGEVIRCIATGKVFKVENGQKRWYSWDAYVRAGKPKFVEKNCSIVSALPNGPDM